MKRILLTLMVCFLSFTGRSQQAYQAPDIIQCNYEVFDLTQQISVILGNQDPENYSVSFHLTLADAQAGVQPLATPSAYIIATWPRQTIFARVNDNNTGLFATTSFDIVISTGTFIYEDVTACSGYVLPSSATGLIYYTAPNAVGPIAAGTIITQTTTIYVHAENSPCFTDDSFIVTILQPSTVIEAPYTLTACETAPDSGTAIFNLNFAIEPISQLYTVSSDFGFFETLEDAQNNVNPIMNFQYYTNLIADPMVYITFTDDLCITHIVPVNLEVVSCGDASLTGVVRLDADGNGCDASDAPLSGIVVGYNIGNTVEYTYTDANGDYAFYGVSEGNGNVWIQNINGQNFLATPTSLPITYSGTSLQNDFCLSVPAPLNDIVAILSPYGQPVPGFQVAYYVSAFNAGNVTNASGTISLTFDPSLVTPVITGGGNVSGNTITWTYTNLLPQSYAGYIVWFEVATPPTVVIGTNIPYTLTISPSGDDANLANNTYVLNQVGVNSYDPNDITVKEGERITIDQADDYLHYTIRFQNSGTANAQKVRIALPLDANLNINTFQPVSASHTYRANRTTDAVEFIFDNINLPYESADEPGSYGFVTFRIKPAYGITVGQSMSETASIYFDFNEAIVTNTATTTVTTVAGTDVVSAGAFSLLPNPADGKVRIVVSGGISANSGVMITDMLGKKLINQPLSADGYVNISSLSTGIYMVSVTNGNNIATQKLIVR